MASTTCASSQPVQKLGILAAFLALYFCVTAATPQEHLLRLRDQDLHIVLMQEARLRLKSSAIGIVKESYQGFDRSDSKLDTCALYAKMGAVHRDFFCAVEGHRKDVLQLGLDLHTSRNFTAEVKEFAAFEVALHSFMRDAWKDVATYFDELEVTHASSALARLSSANKDTVTSPEHQLEDTSIAANRDASNLQAKLKQTQAALDLERTLTSSLRKQLQSASTSIQHEKQRIEQMQVTAASFKRQLDDTRITANRDASNMETEMKVTREALDSERAEAGSLRKQLQSANAATEHEKQRIDQVQKDPDSERRERMNLRTQLQQVEGSCSAAAAQVGGDAALHEAIASLKNDLKEQNMVDYYEFMELFLDAVQNILEDDQKSVPERNA